MSQAKEEITMSHFHPSLFLRRSLILDAVASGATGALMLAGASLLEGWLGIPSSLMRAAGLVLVPYVAFVGYLATRETLTPAAVWTVIVTNGLWAAASVGLLLSGWIAPTAFGYAFVLAQAAVVAAFGELQYVGMRRPEPAVA
jgi:hypothetical protein